MTTKPRRHIGGSLFASSDERILRRIDTPTADLQVRAVPNLDTHILFISYEHGVSMLAEHPNGYSCHALALRIVAGDVANAKEQAKFIQDCGGMARSLDAIAYWAEEFARVKTNS